MRNTKTPGTTTAKTMIPVILAALLAVMAVVGVGAKDARATTMSDAKQRDAIVASAYRMLKAGVPYESPGSATCDMSGASPECLNRLSYAKASIRLSYTVRGQVYDGRFVKTSVRGDLIFVDSDADGDYGDSGSVTGVYVGDGWIIHQSIHAGKTTTSRLSHGVLPYVGSAKFVSVVPHN